MQSPLRRRLMRKTLIWLPPLPLRGEMSTHPMGQFAFTHRAISYGQHNLYHLGVGGPQLVAVELHKGGHGQESGPLVPIPIRVAGRQAPAVGCSKLRQVGLGFVVPPILRSCQSRLQSVLVPNTKESAMLSELVKLNRIKDNAVDPVWFSAAFRHRLLRQLS